MRTRIATIVLVLACAALAHAQPAPRVARVGIVIASGPALHPAGNKPEITFTARVALLQGLREFGWVEGRNLAVELRFADGHYERLPGLVTELERLPVDVIFAPSDLVAAAAQRASGRVPIVFALLGDPVRIGLVASLARPGTHLTGVSGFLPELVGKQLELLKLALPAARRVVLLVNPHSHFVADVVAAARREARALGLQAEVVTVAGPADMPAAYAAIGAARADALLLMADGILRSQQRQLGAFAVAQRLPLVSQYRCEHPGCLMSYGVDVFDHHRSAARHIDRILRGAAPAELPVERATQFKLTLHRSTAQGIGVALPESLLRIADEVVE